MKINLNQVFYDRKGEVMQDDKVPLTLESVAYTSLTLMFPDEQNLSRDEKMKRGRLAQRITSGAGELELKSEEVTLIKTCIGKAFGPWIVVQSEDMLEGPPAS